jgi:hypothetical protein
VNSMGQEPSLTSNTGRAGLGGTSAPQAPAPSLAEQLVTNAVRAAHQAREKSKDGGKGCVLTIAEDNSWLSWSEQVSALADAKVLLAGESLNLEERDTSFHKNVNVPTGAFMQVALKRVQRKELWVSWGD